MVFDTIPKTWRLVTHSQKRNNISSIIASGCSLNKSSTDKKKMPKIDTIKYEQRF